MMRLPKFHYHAPSRIDEAAKILASHPPADAMILAGGTDLIPNMKRRQQTPGTVIALRNIASLREIVSDGAGGGIRIGAGVTLTGIVRSERIRANYTGLWQAAAQIATPHLRNMGTIGGNLCLDTRCNYYDQNYEWRKAINFCMKKDGDICWVAPGSSRCLAVSSTDSAPALMALGARVRLVSPQGERTLALEHLYQNDGIEYITRRPDEILTDVVLDPASGSAASGTSASGGGWKSTYWKLRRRGSFDFPVLGVAAAVRFGTGGVVEEARVVLGAVASRPLVCTEAATGLAGQPLTDGAISLAAEHAWQLAKPMDNTDYVYHWRKRVTREFVGYALRELRGDDMRATRTSIARQDLLQIV